MNLTPFRPGELAAHGIDPYDSAARRSKIIFAVLLIHVLLIAGPLVWAEIDRLLDPPKIVMKVGLVNLPEGNSLDVPKDQTGKPEPPVAAVEPEPAPSDPAPAEPDPPAPDPVKVETPPKVEPPPKVETPPTPPPPKKVETPKVKPPKKTETPKKTEPLKKTEPPKKTETPKKKYLKPEEIRKSGKRIDTPKTDPKAEAQRRAAEQARAEAARREGEIRKQVAAGARDAVRTYGSVAGGEQGIPATKEYYAYIDELKKTLEQRWHQPNSVELDGKRPAAKVTLTIEKDGTVRSSDFVRTGNAAMDQSVANLLSRLKAVAPPPHAQAMTFEVTLRVR